MDIAQRVLSSSQIEAFYSDLFARDQLRHFTHLAGGRVKPGSVVVDVGGGCGFFAAQVHRGAQVRVRVLDTDPKSIEACHNLGETELEAVLGDALCPPVHGDEGIVCFNLILHHLVANTEAETRKLQQKALMAWKDKCDYIFVNEYVYDSFMRDISGRMIFEITASKRLSSVAARIARFIPSLRANTFGVGVRFRSHKEWTSLFQECGFEVLGSVRGESERLSLPRRVLLIKDKRRDSFLLKAR